MDAAQQGAQALRLGGIFGVQHEVDRAGDFVQRRVPLPLAEAEQGVLGSMLLSPRDTIAECIAKINDEYFYVPAHQTIYSALAEMYDAREAIDIITLQQRLKNKQLLEEVGGISYLATLPDTVPSSANLSYYLDIVQEKYLLRKMIRTCTDVVSRVYDYEGEVDALMDEVERDILRISEARVESTAVTMKELVRQSITTIEQFHQRL